MLQTKKASNKDRWQDKHSTEHKVPLINQSEHALKAVHNTASVELHRKPRRFQNLKSLSVIITEVSTAHPDVNQQTYHLLCASGFPHLPSRPSSAQASAGLLRSSISAHVSPCETERWSSILGHSVLSENRAISRNYDYRFGFLRSPTDNRNT